MSTERNDGGPAFPVPAVYDPSREQINSSAAYTGESGLSLRDYFAAKAMHAVICTPSGFTVEGADHVALIAYQMADAMLKARQS